MVPRESRKKAKKQSAASAESAPHTPVSDEPSAAVAESTPYTPVSDEEWEAFFRRSVLLRPYPGAVSRARGSVLTGLVPDAAAETPVTEALLGGEAAAAEAVEGATSVAEGSAASPATLTDQWREKVLERGLVIDIVEGDESVDAAVKEATAEGAVPTIAEAAATAALAASAEETAASILTQPAESALAASAEETAASILTQPAESALATMAEETAASILTQPAESALATMAEPTTATVTAEPATAHAPDEDGAAPLPELAPPAAETTVAAAPAPRPEAVELDWRDHDDLVLLGVVLHWCLRGVPLDSRPAAVRDAVQGVAQRYSGLVGRLTALLPPR